MSEERNGGKARPGAGSDPAPDRASGGAVDWGSVGEYAVIGFVFPLTLMVGFFVGRWLGSLLGGPVVGMVAGVLLGAVAAFWNLYSTLRRLERREAGRRDAGADEGRGESPD